MSKVAMSIRNAGKLIFCFLLCSIPISLHAQKIPRMYYQDASRLGIPFAKDPSVIQFNGRFLMYYSLPGRTQGSNGPAAPGVEGGWGIGIAESTNLVQWSKVGEILPVQAVEKKGIAAPGARVIGGKVHLFYQTYGSGKNDSICHAVSSDGIHFDRDPGNPVYHPTQMPWSVGRAIDAEVLLYGQKVYLYFATRDPDMKIQMIGMAEADLSSSLGAGAWHDVSIDAPLLKPDLPWEGECIEAPSVLKHGRYYYLFFGGSYNSARQQIGVARSLDAKHWQRTVRQTISPGRCPRNMELVRIGPSRHPAGRP